MICFNFKHHIAPLAFQNTDGSSDGAIEERWSIDKYFALVSFSILGVDGKILPVIVYDVDKRRKSAAGFGGILFRER